MLSYCLKCRKKTESKNRDCKDKLNKTNDFMKMCGV